LSHCASRPALAASQFARKPTRRTTRRTHRPSRLQRSPCQPAQPQRQASSYIMCCPLASCAARLHCYVLCPLKAHSRRQRVWARAARRTRATKLSSSAISRMKCKTPLAAETPATTHIHTHAHTCTHIHTHTDRFHSHCTRIHALAPRLLTLTLSMAAPLPPPPPIILAHTRAWIGVSRSIRFACMPMTQV
jgi:hypothetical protein